jgi:hypothetical protein
MITYAEASSENQTNHINQFATNLHANFFEYISFQLGERNLKCLCPALRCCNHLKLEVISYFPNKWQINVKIRAN